MSSSRLNIANLIDDDVFGLDELIYNGPRRSTRSMRQEDLPIDTTDFGDVPPSYTEAQDCSITAIQPSTGFTAINHPPPPPPPRPPVTPPASRPDPIFPVPRVNRRTYSSRPPAHEATPRPSTVAAPSQASRGASQGRGRGRGGRRGGRGGQASQPGVNVLVLSPRRPFTIPPLHGSDNDGDGDGDSDSSDPFPDISVVRPQSTIPPPSAQPPAPQPAASAPNTNPNNRASPRWSDAQKQVFMTTLADLSKKGKLYSETAGWLKRALVVAAGELITRWPTIEWDYERLRNRWNTCRDNYRLWTEFFQKTGVAFNESTGRFEADDDTWASFLESRPPGAKWLKTTPLEYRDEHAMIFAIDWATGKYIVRPEDRYREWLEGKDIKERDGDDAVAAPSRKGKGKARARKRRDSTGESMGSDSEEAPPHVRPIAKRRLTTADSMAKLADSISGTWKHLSQGILQQPSSSPSVAVAGPSTAVPPAVVPASPTGHGRHLEMSVQVLMNDSPYRRLWKGDKRDLIRGLRKDKEMARLFANVPSGRLLFAEMILEDEPFFIEKDEEEEEEEVPDDLD